MFAVGDKVFYIGHGNLPKGVQLTINRVNGDYIGLEGYPPRRYKNTSFVKELNKAPSLLEQLCKEVDAKGVGTCSYALEFESGERRLQVRDICHARLSFGMYREYDIKNPGDLVLKSVALNIKGHLKGLGEEQTKHYRRMVDYILHRSPWRFAFLEESKIDAFNSGVLIDVTKGINYCVAAAIALRSASEFKDKCKMFYDLVELYIPEHYAFILSALIKTDVKTGSPIVYNFEGGHHVIVGNHDFDDLMTYFKSDEPYKLGQPGHPYKSANGITYAVWKSLGKHGSKNPLFTLIGKHLGHMVKIVKTGWSEYKAIPVDTVEDKLKFAIGFMKAAIK